MAALQIRLTAFTVDILSKLDTVPFAPTLDLLTLAFEAPSRADTAAGIKKGDILLAVDGTPIHSRADEAHVFLSHKAGDTLELNPFGSRRAATRWALRVNPFKNRRSWSSTQATGLCFTPMA